MIGRISPAGLNPWLADQGFGISRSTPGKRTVERLEDEAEATATRLRWTRGAGSRPGVAKTDDTLKGPQAIGSTARRADRVHMATHGLSNTRTRTREFGHVGRGRGHQTTATSRLRESARQKRPNAPGRRATR